MKRKKSYQQNFFKIYESKISTKKKINNKKAFLENRMPIHNVWFQGRKFKLLKIWLLVSEK